MHRREHGAYPAGSKLPLCFMHPTIELSEQSRLLSEPPPKSPILGDFNPTVGFKVPHEWGI
jgi:hypothetical protein